MGAITVAAPIELLWQTEAAPSAVDALDKLPTVTNPIKVHTMPYGIMKVIGRSDAAHNRVGSATDAANAVHIHYYDGIVNMIQAAGINPQTQGLAGWSNAQMDAFANQLKNSDSKHIMTDFEPSVSAGEEWKFQTFPSSQHPDKIAYIADKVFQLSGKIYFDLFCSRDFTFNGKTVSFGGDNIVDVDNEIALFDNPSAATNIPAPNYLFIESGYTSVIYAYHRPVISQPEPANLHYPQLYRHLANLHAYSMLRAIKPNAKIVSFNCFFSDKDTRHTEQMRFKPIAKDGSVNPTGYVRMKAVLPRYSGNLVSDFIFITACMPQVVTFNSWILGVSEDPFGALHYARRNGNQACHSGDVNQYEADYGGGDNPPCPTGPYHAESIIGYNDELRGLARYFQFQSILDGTQTDSYPAFEYKRSGDTNWTSVAASNGSAFARAFKYKRPFLVVWTNTNQNKRVVIFQDCYAEPFEAVEFRATINNTQYSYTAEGNNAFAFKIEP